MSQSKLFQFNLNLGAYLEASSAVGTVYGIRDGAPEELAAFSIDRASFEYNVFIEGFTYFYIVVKIESYSYKRVTYSAGNRILQYVAVFSTDDDMITVWEPSTVAATYCFARFLKLNSNLDIELSASDRAARVAYMMMGNFIKVGGSISKVIRTSPNGLETNSYALFNFLNNLLYYAVADDSVYSNLLDLSSDNGSASSLFGAILNLAKAPFTNVEEIYQLISEKEQVFHPSLPDLSLQPGKSPIPNQWTLTVKVNDSGAQNFPIGGPALIAFDKEDKVWVTNNTRQGTPNSSTYCVVLNPDGSPCDFSPVSGGGLLGAGFGVVADQAGEKIYFGNFGWGPTDCNPQTGSISVFKYDGTVLSPPNGYTNGLSRIQGMTMDNNGNLWMASWGTQRPLAPADNNAYNFPSQNSAIVVYLNADPNQMVAYHFDSPYHKTFDVVVDEDGNAYVSNAGYNNNNHPEHNTPSSVYKFKIEDGQLVKMAEWISDYQKPGDDASVGYESFRQVQLTPGGEVLVGGVISHRIVRFDRDLNKIGVYTTNINGPWGVNVDRDGTILVSNFLRQRAGDSNEHTQHLVGSYGITIFREGDNANSNLMTLPSGGHEVMLANGFPLYGQVYIPGAKAPVHIPCYDPLMRMTANCIDRAGNLWAFNNWKASGYIDISQNPGGDGLVIFVGVAAPLE